MFLIEIEWIPNGITQYAPTDTVYKAILKAEDIVRQAKHIPCNIGIFELENKDEWSHNRKHLLSLRTIQ